MLVKVGVAAVLGLALAAGESTDEQVNIQSLNDFQQGQDVVSAASLLSQNVGKDDDRRRMLWGKYYYGSKYSWSKFSSKGRDSSSSDGKRSKRDSSDSRDSRDSKDSSDNRKKSSKRRDSSSSDNKRKSASKRDSSSDDRRSSKKDDSSSSDGKRSKRGRSSDSSDGRRSKRDDSSSSSDSSRGSKGGKGGRGSSSDSSDGKRSKRKGSRSSSDSSDGRKGSKGRRGSSSSSSDGSKGKKGAKPTPRPTSKPTPKPTLKPIEADCETSVYLGRVWSRTNLDTNEFYDYSGWYHLVENNEEAYWRRDDHSYVLKMELFDNKNYLVLGDYYDTTGSSKIYYYLDASEWNRYENPITTHKADENDEWFCLTQDDEDYYYSKGKYSKHGKHSKSKKSKSKSSKSGGSSGANCKVSTGVFNVLDCNNEDRDFCDWDAKLSYFPKFLQCEFSDKKCGLLARMFGKC